MVVNHAYLMRNITQSKKSRRSDPKFGPTIGTEPGLDPGD
jgi:hypothetical protein